jgi:low molecular weight protein-tyrosine phosphatase
MAIGHAGAMVTDSSAARALPQARDPRRPYRICVVCLGNICRSPMAEVILRDELAAAGLAGKVEVDSAGTGDWHLGESMDPRARAELSRRGYDGSQHEARQIQPSWLADYDLILAMDRGNLASLRRMAAGDSEVADRIRLMRSFDPTAAEQSEVPDPYNGGPEEYVQVFDLVEPAARGLASQLAVVR